MFNEGVGLEAGLGVGSDGVSAVAIFDSPGMGDSLLWAWLGEVCAVCCGDEHSEEMCLSLCGA